MNINEAPPDEEHREKYADVSINELQLLCRFVSYRWRIENKLRRSFVCRTGLICILTALPFCDPISECIVFTSLEMNVKKTAALNHGIPNTSEGVRHLCPCPTGGVRLVCTKDQVGGTCETKRQDTGSAVGIICERLSPLCVCVSVGLPFNSAN